VTLVKEAGNLFPYQTSIEYLNSRLRYNLFRFPKRTPPIWNSISCFHMVQCVVIGMSFCICLPYFVIIRRSSAELWRHVDFSRWRP